MHTYFSEENAMVAALTRYFKSSIGRKQLMALTGLGLCGFLVSHLAGNVLLLISPDAFNVYAHKLISLGALLYLAEGGLLVLFLTHLALAIKLTLENKHARGEKYYAKKRTGRGETLMSATMPYTGLLFLVFIITHLLQFKYGAYYYTQVDGVPMRDMYRTVLEYYKNPLNTLWYVVAMAGAALHTAHGFASAFQSLGWNHSLYLPGLKKLGLGYAIVVAGGFALLSVLMHMKGVSL